MLTAIIQHDVEEDDLREPPVGRMFYKLEADPAPGQSGPYPVELAVRVTGKVIGAPAADQDPDERPAADPEAGDDEEGASDIVLLAGGVGGIVVGLVAGGAAAGRRRP